MTRRRSFFNWSGPQPSLDDEQVANAHDSFVDLTPVSEAPAEKARSNWAATLPDTDDVPLIWEGARRGYR